MLSEERIGGYKDLEEIIGDPLLFEVKNIPIPNNNRIYAIEEWLNPTGSIFDRLYPYLFQQAEDKGYIVPGITPVIEASTGNAGASFAWCAKKLGYNDCTVITHADTPRSRTRQIESYGARVKYSPAGQYAKGYVKMLEDILEHDRQEKGGTIGTNPHRLYCVTKINPTGRKVYYQLVDKVVRELNGNRIDYFLGVIGSGTSFSGIAKRLKHYWKETKTIVVEPIELPTVHTFINRNETIQMNRLSHDIFGIAPFGIPRNKLNIDFSTIDDIRLFKKDDWINGCDLLSKFENRPVGRSSGAVFTNCLSLVNEIKNKNILMIFYDPIWKYDEHYPYLK